MSADLYAQIVAVGIEHDSHESDLYVKDTPEARALIDAAGLCFTPFTSRIDGTPWLEVPFAYTPWWDKRLHRDRLS